MTAFFRLFAALAALSIVSALAAQGGCPHTIAVTVPHTETTGLPVNCGSGIKVEFGGITVQTGDTVCPLWVLFTPEHERPQAAASETKTLAYAKVESWMFQLECQKSYFLIFSIGSSCVHVNKFPAAAFERLSTVRC